MTLAATAWDTLQYIYTVEPRNVDIIAWDLKKLKCPN